MARYIQEGSFQAISLLVQNTEPFLPTTDIVNSKLMTTKNKIRISNSKRKVLKL